ncbi:MAG TPA: helix-turn-helix transcriptional regulator [Candidatus Acidoferrales bacterium]|nr:helix-turn-helix transcriptional regulator [Candidatus Acidoferrales bacterium]
MNCLIDELRRRVHTGQATERGLAQMAGVSQPHLHHVLKGKRHLSPAKADLILQHLGVDLLELIRLHQ